MIATLCNLVSRQQSCLVRGAGVRPVPLEIHIQTLDIASLEARMQAMARPAYSAVAAHARGGKPAILFVPTRKHARLTALDLLTYAAADGQPKRFLQVGDCWSYLGKETAVKYTYPQTSILRARASIKCDASFPAALHRPCSPPHERVALMC